MPLEELTSFKWTTHPFPLARLALRVQDLATRTGLTIRHWDADGLGPALGFCIRVSSGRIYCFEELEFEIQHHQAVGPMAYVDSSELAILGPDVLVAELIEATGISQSDLITVADRAAQSEASDLASRTTAARPR